MELITSLAFTTYNTILLWFEPSNSDVLGIFAPVIFFFFYAECLNLVRLLEMGYDRCCVGMCPAFPTGAAMYHISLAGGNRTGRGWLAL